MTGDPSVPPRRRLFGTDGVRGVAGDELTAELALALGRAATGTARGAGIERPRVLVIRDTRESGEMLEAALAAGVSAAGGDVLLGGVLPTPAAPLLVARHRLDLAAVISASHNPYRDNGIKFFGADGMKLSDATELDIERRVQEDAPVAPGPIGGIGPLPAPRRTTSTRSSGASARCASTVSTSCSTARTGRPTASRPRPSGAAARGSACLATRPTGATSTTASARRTSTAWPRRSPRAATTSASPSMATATACSPPTAPARSSTATSCIALSALHLRRAGALAGDGVAVTVMTNYGFHAAMEEAGVTVATTAVGDRAVLEELRARGWSLGGEQSGHIIQTAFAPSGDGIASALLTLEALGGADLAARNAMRKLPQRLVNVRVVDRDAAMADADLVAATAHENSALAGRGRVLVRASGTEPLVRVMVEAPSAEEADAVCGRLVDLVEGAHGAVARP